MFILSIVSGVLIILSAVFLLRKEFLKAIKQQNIYLEQAKVFEKENLSQLLLDMQKSIDDMNQAFYEIANDLEGKYSIHEKEIKDSTKDFNDIKIQIDSIMTEMEKYKSESKDLTQNLIQAPQTSDVMGLDIEEPIAISMCVSNDSVKIPPLINQFNVNDTFQHMTESDEKEIIHEQKEDGFKEIPIEIKEKSAEELEMINKICFLSTQGYDKRQIAKELGIGLGALDLIIKLNAIDL